MEFIHIHDLKNQILCQYESPKHHSDFRLSFMTRRQTKKLEKTYTARITVRNSISESSAVATCFLVLPATPRLFVGASARLTASSNSASILPWSSSSGFAGSEVGSVPGAVPNHCTGISGSACYFCLLLLPHDTSWALL